MAFTKQDILYNYLMMVLHIVQCHHCGENLKCTSEKALCLQSAPQSLVLCYVSGTHF